MNEELYYVKKLGHYLINPNQFHLYKTIIWDNPFDSNRELCLKIENGNTIDLIANC